MNIQNLIDTLRAGGKEITIEYFKITLPAEQPSAADERPSTVASEPKCESCGRPFKPFTWKGADYTAETAYSWSLKRNGRAICIGCVKKEATA